MKKITHTAKITLKILNDKKQLWLLQPIQATEELNWIQEVLGSVDFLSKKDNWSLFFESSYCGTKIHKK